MKKYKIWVTIQYIDEIVRCVEVNAKTEKNAIKKARMLARKGNGKLISESDYRLIHDQIIEE
jgi:hypothetical protein